MKKTLLNFLSLYQKNNVVQFLQIISNFFYRDALLDRLMSKSIKGALLAAFCLVNIQAANAQSDFCGSATPITVGVACTNGTTAGATTTASPASTTRYKLTITDLAGCGFIATDDVLVSVQPPVSAFAGNDTNAVKGQPHQLMGSGGVQYLWSPTAPLNNPAIQKPQPTLYADTKFTLIVRDVAGCTGFDTVFVKVYDDPQYYLPNVFSPNGVGLNDVFRPVPVGMVNTEWFRVYKRFGELVFETNQWLKGLDDSFKGKKQPVGVYVWVIKGTDKNGKPVDMKGTRWFNKIKIGLS